MLGRFVLFLCLVVRSTFVWLLVVCSTVTKMLVVCSTLVWLLVVCSTVTKMLVVCSTLVWLLVVCSTVTKMFGRVFDLSLAVGRVFDCY